MTTANRKSEKGRYTMTDLLSKVSWWRILVASLATYLASFVLTVTGILVYTLFTAWQGSSSEASLEWLSSGLGTWSVPVLTFFAAAWAAHKAELSTAILYGFLVGLLVAIVFGLVFFWPFDLVTLTLFVVVVVVGPLGGLVGRGSGRSA